MKKFNIDIFANFDTSEEEKRKRLEESYERANQNPENMSYWLPNIESSTTKQESSLRIPATKIISLPLERFDWLQSEKYTPETIKEFNDFLKDGLGDFLKEQTLFMKSGIFSNKFEFSTAVVTDRETIGKQFLDLYYTSMLVGAGNTNEVVFREFIADKENRLTIYDGMPLHTEYRVFYDFDNQEVVGVSNYWHPHVMRGNIKEEDEMTYNKEKDNILSDYENYKTFVIEEVQKWMKGVMNLKGKWSIDVMKNDDAFYLIDMARMERSALVPQMETV